MVHELGLRTSAPVADSFAAFQNFTGDRALLMTQSMHPNRDGHALVLAQLLPLFLPTPKVP